MILADCQDRFYRETGPHSVSHLPGLLHSTVDRVDRISLASDYEFDPNPVFWAFGPQTLRVTLQPA